MIYVQDSDPVLVSYKNSLVTIIKTAELLDSSDAVLTVVAPIDCVVEGSSEKEWYAIFDPQYFKANQQYKINWIGTDTNGADYEELETGLEVKVSTDFYQTFIDTLRTSLFDDGQVCDYSVKSMVNASKYALSYFNAQAPITDFTVDQIPYNLLLDLSKIYLYRGKASREAIETFMYNDITKSFNVDRSQKLLALAENLARSAEAQLALYKRQLRPVIKGLGSRYARRNGSTARTLMTSRVIFRNFTR